MILKRPLLISLVLGIGMSLLLGSVQTSFPNSETASLITDALALPGALVAGLVYPAGVHTGSGAPNWGFAVIASNLVIYILFWYGLLKVAGRIQDRRQRRSVQPKPAA